MKKLFLFLVTFCVAVSLFAQSDEELFGSEDDDFFEDDGIIELEAAPETESNVLTDLRKGVLYEDGNVKVGGNFSTSITTVSTVYTDDDKSFGEHLAESSLTPKINANLIVDARPTQNLRMYTKFGLKYPFKDQASATLGYHGGLSMDPAVIASNVDLDVSISEWLSVKEIFTDFSIADTAFFRFGLHTVTWGTGYFFSPVSDMINTSSIDPFDVDAQVDGCLNLRTQIVFPGTQNCLWFYLIPPTENSKRNATDPLYVKDTAFAYKGEILLGNWELGAGAYWCYEKAPKVMATITGSIKKLNLFGEGVYQYGSAVDWKNSSNWNDTEKDNIFQLTGGFSCYWKTPAIMLAGQYYFDGNNEDKLLDIESPMKITIPRITQGHNIAAMLSFGRIFGTTDLTSQIITSVNIGRDKLDETTLEALKSLGMTSSLNSGTILANISYSPISELTFSCGPLITFETFDDAPTVSIKCDFKLGGGKF